MASKSEHKALFESDLEVSTVCTTDSESTADSAPSNDETEWTEDMSLDFESTQEIESHLIFKEEYVGCSRDATHRNVDGLNCSLRLILVQITLCMQEL